jgi:hypothetical protein
MKFQMRHYEALAAVLRETNLKDEARYSITSNLADMLKADNERFDLERFLKASRPTSISAS